MADSSRVEELRKRYHENPRRFFAPLANEYRKGGFLDRAILLCQKHLGEQPGNMNGLIVYGQTLYESGRHEEARGPFEAALEVDPENLIALRHLGDIARLGGDNPAAQRWYSRVLEADRRNEEVRELLDQVGGPVEEPRSGESARPAPAAAPDAAPRNDAATLELLGSEFMPVEPPSAPSLAAAKTLEVTPRALTPPAAAKEIESRPSSSPKTVEVTPRRPPATPAKAMRRASLLDIDFDFGELSGAADMTAPVKAAAPLMGAEAAEYGFAATDDLPLLDTGTDERPAPLLSTDSAASLIDLPPEAVSLGDVAPIPGLEAAEFDLDVAPLVELESTAFDAGGAAVAPLAELETAEFQVPAADAPLGGVEGLEQEVEFEVPSAAPLAEPPSAPEFQVPVATPPAGELVFLDDDAMDSVAAEPAILTPASMPVVEAESVGKLTPASQPAIVSETMAELYLRQGHREEAIEVYRKLIAQDPSDAALRGRLAALESERQASRQSLEFDVPADAVEDVNDRAPANAMLAEVSFADLALSTPAVESRPSAPLRATPSGPTAREFFSAFAKRTLSPDSAPPREAITPPSGSWAVPAAISSLDDLFGIEVSDEDQRAANYLSGVGTTSAPSGTSTFDALFASKEPAPAPRASVPRASEKLRFDQFFSASSSTPVATPTPEPPSANPMQGGGAGKDATPGGDDDLDQFQGWLKGLTQ